MDTPDEANDKISSAMVNWVDSLLDMTDGGGIGVLGDWAAVVCMVDVREDGVPVSNYYLAFKGGNALPHIVSGLFHRGLQELRTMEDNNESS